MQYDDLGSSRARWLVGLGILLLFWLIGPWVLVATCLTLFSERVRHFLAPRFKGRLALVATLGLVLILIAVVWAPRGRLPIVSGPGIMMAPKYDGRPAPLKTSAASANGGPLGEQPVVTSRSYGVRQCGRIAFLKSGDLAATCVSPTGEQAVVIDHQSLQPRSWRQLPPRPSGGLNPFTNACTGTSFYLDARDRMVLADADRRIRVLMPAESLKEQHSYDLRDRISANDCLVAVQSGEAGRVWFASRAGVIGVLDIESGRVHTRRLGEQVTTGLSTDPSGRVYVLTSRSLVQLRASASGIELGWRTDYERGEGPRKGQFGLGSGTSPLVLPSGQVAFTDNANDRIRVNIVAADTGQVICREAVFESGDSATHSALHAVGSGVLVVNNSGYSGPWSTWFGRSTTPGIARVDLRGASCATRWSSELTSPTANPGVSAGNGLAYFVTKSRSWWGVDAWYLTAVEVANGHTVFRVRIGVGAQFTPHRSGVYLAPDGSALVPTISGLVRVRDRTTKQPA